MRGVILAGGLGSRLHLFTRRVANKHCALVYDRPMIEYPLSTLVQAGIDEIAIVVGSYHTESVIKVVGDGREFGCKSVSYFFQRDEGGIAAALKLVEPFTRDDNFAVILGDNLFEMNIKPAVDKYDAVVREESYCFLKEVPDPHRFGVAELGTGGRVKSIEEKPKDPKSNMAITGLYFFDPTVFIKASTLQPSKRGELEITDILDAYRLNDKLYHETLEGYWSDMGTIPSLDRSAQWLKENTPKLRAGGRFDGYQFPREDGSLGDYLE